MTINYKYGKYISMSSLDRNIKWRIANNNKMKQKVANLHFIGYRESCPICNYSTSKKFGTFLGVSYLECKNCGHLYQYEICDPSSIKEIYENTSQYLSHMVDDNYFAKRVEMIAMPKVEYVNSNVEKSNFNDEWLDIGCGGCEILYSAKNLGWNVRGIETGDIGIVQAKKLGIQVEQQFITSHNAVDLIKSPYLISLFEVIEHFENPKEILELILRNTYSCKYLVIGVPHHPSLSAFSASLFPDEIVRHIIVPDHIHIFSEKSLELLLKICGFEIKHCWKFGQDFYELLSIMTQQAQKDIDSWPEILYNSINDVQFALDKNGFCDSMLVIAKREIML